jgi:hypothetical protein
MVHVGNLQRGFVDGCLEGHGKSLGSGLECNRGFWQSGTSLWRFGLAALPGRVISVDHIA